MSRTPIAAANWKMHKTSAEAAALMEAVCAGAPPRNGYEIVICPPFTALPAVTAAANGQPGIAIGGQNCFWESEGAFTGEVSAGMLVELGCSYVIIGHSERRQYFGETDKTVNMRVRAALDAGLLVIACIGETAEERDAGQTTAVLTRQLDNGLGTFTGTDWARLVIAYEPVWAIGTGNTATPEMANEVHALIRSWIVANVNADVAAAIRILYGGSVKPDNAAALFAQEHIDGGLIGGASLTHEHFLAIADALAGAPTT